MQTKNELIRKDRIEEILTIIKKLKNYNKKNFILEISSKYGVAVRKAREYLEVAEFQNGL